MRRFFYFVVATLVLCTAPTEHALGFIPSAFAAASCVANEHLDEKAISFIGRCRKGSIHREFPSELSAETLGTIKNGVSDRHKKAWKLLNDSRFAK